MLIADTHTECTSATEWRCGAELTTTAQELRRTALSVRVVGEETVAHVAFALHVVVVQFSRDVVVDDAEGLVVATPDGSLASFQCIVIAESVTLINEFAQSIRSGGVQVILDARVFGGIVAQCIEVGVVERVASQHVFQRLIVASDILSDHESHTQSLQLVELRSPCR